MRGDALGERLSRLGLGGGGQRARQRRHLLQGDGGVRVHLLCQIVAQLRQPGRAFRDRDLGKDRLGRGLRQVGLGRGDQTFVSGSILLGPSRGRRRSRVARRIHEPIAHGRTHANGGAKDRARILVEASREVRIREHLLERRLLADVIRACELQQADGRLLLLLLFAEKHQGQPSLRGVVLQALLVSIPGSRFCPARGLIGPLGRDVGGQGCLICGERCRVGHVQ